MAAVSPARAAAFQILMAVERGKAHSDELLRGKNVSALSEADRHLATALVLGSLRWQIWLDAQIDPLLKRPNAKLDPEARVPLRMGAYQLLKMDRIPAHAAIDESVALTKQAGHQFAARMVNAVLRKLSGGAPRPEPSDEPLAGDAATEAYPRWMVERWVRFYGEDAAQTICRHGQSQPITAIRVIDSGAEAELVTADIELTPGSLLEGARIVTSGDVTAIAAFREGRVRLQDEGSQLVAEIAGRGDAILDCCAAPGGKTLILAERNPTTHLVACEVSAERLAQLQERLALLDERVEFRHGDAGALRDSDAFDVVLADVPCSGTGTLGRNPEIRHRLREEDLARQAERQEAILRAAIRAVRPGGRVVYSTCSLEPEENEQVVAKLLAGAPDAQVIPMQERIAELASEGILKPESAESLRNCVTSEGYLRLLPGKFQTDGFFIAMLGKRSH
jgi:16S rRNA (cytosine967-C5)-methyltransferase